ncbi:uncharacterized protein LTR77_001024 [Saxophila tyrrhenica]|uniref:Xaa-Pro dipeptidyl-peptidase C-terminal domain-containing protein n=1 Tax=Saxophila tyrrhenica TaxID=1690608 RepID=A0AAV9PS73_9PEZI|nr:hypothetical protein LTR77_001024 [Saxophila tyrrhenica]
MDQDTEELSFTHKFEHACTLLGSARAVLFMSTPDHDDMDVHIQIHKTDASGKVLQYINIPKEDRDAVGMTKVELVNPMVYLGPIGALRASYRQIDQNLSTERWPEHNFSQREMLERGQIVQLEIGLWQTGIRFEAGEQLVLKVSGHPMTLAEFPPLRGAMQNANKGRHSIHVGGEHISRLIIPTVPSS